MVPERLQDILGLIRQAQANLAAQRPGGAADDLSVAELICAAVIENLDRKGGDEMR